MGRKKIYLTEEERNAAHREALKRYRERHLEEERERTKRYRQENHEKIRERHRKYRQENSEKIRELNKGYYQENKEKILERSKRYRQENHEKERERHKRWQAENTEKWRAIRLLNHYKRLDKEHNRGECTLTQEWIIDNIFTKPCHYCGKEGWDVIGCDRIDNSKPHTPDNVVPCCAECNKKRSSKTYEEFYDSRKVQEKETIQ